MIKNRIIPCLLVKGGRCVKGVNFDSHRDTGHPVTNAKIYDAQGADELIFLDITASEAERGILYDIISATAEECFMPLTVGGGVRTMEDIHNLLRIGADKVAINTAAVENPGIITAGAEKYGKQCIVVSIDYKLNDAGVFEVFTHSGSVATGLDPISFAKKVEALGAGEIMFTSINHEGMRKGYDFEMLKKVTNAVGIPVIASGGAGDLEDLRRAIVESGASAVSLGSLLHFTDQNVIKMRNYLHTHGVPVRIKA